jgi:hypothetical protein
VSSKVIMGVFGALVGSISQAAWCAPSHSTAEQTALSQCVSLRTTGADRIMTARWLFAMMSQIVDLSAVTAEHTKELNQGFAKLLTRLVTKDCTDEVRPVAAGNFEDAFAQVGKALGETAMNELMSGKDVDEAMGAYTDFLSEEDFKPFLDSLPKRTK